MGFVVVDGSMRPPELTREEWYSRDRQRLVDVKHEQVAAFCRQRQMEAPTLSEWQNASEVATFLIRRRNDHGMAIVSRKVIAERAFYPNTVAPITVTRSLQLLRDLAIVPASQRCKKATAYVIDLDRADEIKATPLAPPDPAPTIESRDASFANHLGSIDESSRSPNDSQMITECSMNDASSLYSLTNSKTTPTTTDDSGWRAVVVEVESCGVNQAATAVATGRDRNASVDQVRAIIAEWRKRRLGWAHAAVNLYRRLMRFDAALSPADGWPPADEAHQAKLERERRKRERRDALERQHRDRVDFAAAAEAARSDWNRDQFFRSLAEASPELAYRVKRSVQESERDLQPRPPPEA